MESKPYLSLVATSRNDEHGGNTLYRTQIFVDSFLEQCERYRIPAELIIVEWNPPSDKAPLAEAIEWTKQSEWTSCRIITVPWERHVLFTHGRSLPLFQMIAKNVGIRRAKGDFILATNIDILLSNELMEHLATRPLRADRMYRADRYDIDSSIPKDVPLDEKLEFARNNIVRKNRRLQPRELVAMQDAEAPLDEIVDFMVASGNFEIENEGNERVLVTKRDAPFSWIHHSTCGDFTMISRSGWERIHGYAELETYSLHIDTLGVHCAHRAGLLETAFLPPLVCYHIEHALGSGYTPENKMPLFERLERQGIGWIDYPELRGLLRQMEKTQDCLDFNSAAWGMRDIPLDETVCSAAGTEVKLVPADEQAPPFAPVSAIEPLYASDRVFRQPYLEEMETFKALIEKQKQDRISAVDALKTALDNKDRVIAQKTEELENLRTAHEKSLATIEEFREKVVGARDHLAKYRKAFGWLERLGMFR